MRSFFQKQSFKRKYGEFDDGAGTPKSRRISSDDQFYKLAKCKKIYMNAGFDRFKVDDNGYLVDQKTYCPECIQDKITIANALFRYQSDIVIINQANIV